MESNQLNSKSLALWGGAALLIAVVIIGVVKLASPSGTTPSDGMVAGLQSVSSSDWISGATSSPAVLIEYSDFQCPACGAYYPLVEKVVSDYKGKLALVYRHFPLPQHPQAKPAAYAAEAAGKQGKFWDMYRLLFEGQDEWANKSDAEKTFEIYATRLNLNLARFRTDVESSDVHARVDANSEGGKKAGVNATPTFFLNGRKLQNPTSYEMFKQKLDAGIASTT